ncbi:MAG: hypothetical protein AAGJ52_08090 [Pseudomonadota bacterium]
MSQANATSDVGQPSESVTSLGQSPTPIAWRWASVFVPDRGCDGEVLAIERLADGHVMLGGEFTVCDDVAAANIVIFDPSDSSFSAIISDSVNGVSGRVNALQRAPSGIYVGGFFTHAGNELVNNIALFDGQQWNSVTNGGSIGLSGGEVRTLQFEDGLLYAGGRFNTGASQSLNRIGTWDGNTWDDMDGGMGGAGFITVNQIILDPNQVGGLYALGDFDEAGGATVNNIARWDGSQWNAIVDSSGAVGLLAIPNQAIVWNGDLIVGGAFSSSGPLLPSVQRYDGSDWVPVGANPPNDAVNAFSDFGGQLVAGGRFSMAGGQSAAGLARFDGTDWVPIVDQDPGVDGEIESLKTVGSNLIIGGQFLEAGGRSASAVARWDGTRFFNLASAEGLGVQEEVRVIGRYQGDLVIGGEFFSAGDTSATRIARLSEQSWQPFGDGFSSAPLVLLEHGGSLYAGGVFTQSAFATFLRIARWDGSAWNAVGAGFSNAVNALVDYNNEVIAAGAFTASGGTPIDRIARFDGTDWQPLGTGVDGIVDAAVVFNGDLVVAGSFSNAGGAPANGLARWDGQSWSALGAGVDGTVTTLIVHDGALYAAGHFSAIDQQTISNVARFDGQSWTAVGNSPPGGTVNALIADGNWLFASGQFDSSGSTTDSNLMVFDGAVWQRVGDGAGHGSKWEINALAFDSLPSPPGLPPPLFVGGLFGKFGPDASANFGKIFAIPDQLLSDRFENIKAP